MTEQCTLSMTIIIVHLMLVLIKWSGVIIRILKLIAIGKLDNITECALKNSIMVSIMAAKSYVIASDKVHIQ